MSIRVAAWVVYLAALVQAAPLQVALPEQVTALGRSKAALQQAYGRLCAPPLSDMDFVLSDLNFKLTRRFTEYSGDISGRMLGALSAAGPVLGEDAAMIAGLCAEMGRYQKADGHFGADEDLAAGIKPQRDMPILWGNGRLLLALVQRYQVTKQADLLKMARGIGDYVVNTRQYYGKPENLQMGGAYAAGYTTCYPSLIEGMVLLADVTKEQKYLDEARHIAGIALMDKSFEHHHSHGRCAAYRGMLDIDRVGGTGQFLPAVQAGVDKIISDYVLPTGGVTEVFDREYPRDEGCSEVDWVMANVLLWRATGATRYLDMADFIVRNHVLASQFPNGGFGHHEMRKMKAGEATYPAAGFLNLGAEAYWCCSMHGTQLLAELARWSVVTEHDALLVTWLTEARARLRVKNRPVTAGVTQIAADAWKVQLEVNGTAELALRLRVPAWTKSLVVDGKTVEGRDGWAEIPCAVQTSRTLDVRFPSDIRILGMYGDKVYANEPRRIVAGPDLYCLPDVNVPEGFVGTENVPVVFMSAEAAEGGRIPVVVQGGKQGAEKVATWLVPTMDRPAGGCRWLFNVKRESDRDLPKLQEYKPTGVPIELLLACDGECELFVNGKSAGTRKGWGETGRLELYVDRGMNVLAIKARTKAKQGALIGWVRMGDRIIVSTAGEPWSAVRCDAPIPPEWLKNARLGADKSVKLVDLAGFGDGPGKHIPAESAGTKARWIWPDTTGASPEQVWLVRCTFQVD